MSSSRMVIFATITTCLPWPIDATPCPRLERRILTAPNRAHPVGKIGDLLMGKLVLEAPAPCAQARKFLCRKEEPTHSVSAKMPPC